jgi:sugar lactone lactonase YvrE
MLMTVNPAPFFIFIRSLGMRKTLRMSLVVGLVLMFVMPISGAIHAQGSDCDLQNGVLIGTLSYGINCLDNNGWNEYKLESSGLPVTSLDDSAICPDTGSILALHIFGMNIYDGKSWSDFEVPTEVVAPNAVACAPGGEIWIAHTGGISHYDGSNWKTFESKTLGSSPFIVGVNDVAVGSDGSVWAATSNSVARFNGGEWQVFENGKGFDQDYSLSDFAVNSDGQPMVVYSSGVLTFDGEKWSSNEAPISTLQKIVIDGKNRAWVGSFSDGVAMLDNGNWTVYNVDKGLSSNSITALAADAQGRIWVGTQWGLNVLDGDQWSAYQMSNSDLLDNDIRHISVLGDGPVLPEAQKKDPGSVTGVLVNGRDPAPNLQVELCTETVGGVFYGATPCEGQPDQMLTTSNDKGEFTFDGVPIGRYEITIETPSGWIHFIGVDSKVEVQSGQKNDLAFIDISK